MTCIDEITTKPAQVLAGLIRERELSCLEVTSAFLKRIDDINPKINAFCTVLHEAALAAAAQADQAFRSGSPIGPLHGLPVALKDLTPTKGVRTTRGSRLFENAVPTEDVELVRRLKKAGAILIGKTNTPEFGHKGETDNLIFGPTRNPWRLDRTPGGSSGGSAAAVAAGLVPFAEGSDGAGSIRIPASMCGIFGFKPSYGRVPDVAGPFSSHTPFFHNGPLARSVGDAALLYQAMVGADSSDPFSVPADQDALISLDHGVAGLRVAFSMNLGYFEVSDEVKLACTRATEAFSALGCVVDEVEVGFDGDLEAAFFTLWCAKLATVYSGITDREFSMLEPVVQGLIERGRELSAVEFGRANLVREVVWGRLCSIFEKYDVLICPTTAVPAFSIENGPPGTINGASINRLLGWFLTYPFNFTGNPAASVPCGFSHDGLPIGMQIIGRRLDDGLVLRASRTFERLSPWPKLANPSS
ncbi:MULTISPECIES: amidase [unclassified Shinella]|uniref:amidase n=1 Tax=unclassified Shinella TaxID=2643062 RepID=UPI00225D55F8|nr:MULTISPECIES: amidase family protein [unclassified Shinella]CAI0335836.1 Indole-3-acetamide hydrolase [Rhizobiaceae bacterium]CAK7262410.1 aspartyl-tRNA(Asn)/glutamyl-tRNA(Gln) amidotransferase subunit A [Shinella sp. WSC3-e]MDC7260395.1 amidase [Shinella sp. YE25]MDC7267247.1 amidase [Shinella sp. HY16]MDC7274134.1 amidase [Shinella sp. YZ44]